MLGTVTDKGKVTIPKEILDRIGIGPGSKLDFVLRQEGNLIVRVLIRRSENLIGLLHRRGRGPWRLAQ